MRFQVCMARPPGYKHAAVLDDSARLMAAALHDLGHDVTIADNSLAPSGTVNVLLGYHLMNEAPAGEYVVWQLEQMSDDEGWLKGNPAALDVLRKARAVWDYSTGNAAWLAQNGIKAHVMPYGYHAALESDAKPADVLCNVLHAGSMNDRRRDLLAQIGQHWTVSQMFGLYGPKRDEVFAAAQLTVNVHYYPAKCCEQMRLSYLLNNGWFCVTEDSTDSPYGDVIPHAPYDELAALVCQWMGKPAEDRAAKADEMRQWFKARPMKAYVEEAINCLPS